LSFILETGDIGQTGKGHLDILGPGSHRFRQTGVSTVGQLEGHSVMVAKCTKLEARQDWRGFGSKDKVMGARSPCAGHLIT
jgi:hypothetical protein